MALKISTGMVNHMMASGSVKSALDGGKLYLFAGPIPASADDATSGATLLCTITESDSGTGINFAAAAVDGVLDKASAETWQGTNAADGTCTFYRFSDSTDDPPTAASGTAKRIQGTVGLAGFDMNLTNNVLVNGAVQNIDVFRLALPKGV
jgi:hypothetical protein